MSEQSVFRSADMSLVQLYIPFEISRDVVYALGESGAVQFRDLNSKINTFQRSYVKEIRRLDNVQRQYRYFKTELENRELELVPPPFIGDSDESVTSNFPTTNEIEQKIEEAQILEERINQLADSTETLETRKQDLVQLRYALKGADSFFAKAKSKDLLDLTNDDVDFSRPFHQQNNFVIGIIQRSKVNVLEKILWRALRGNLFWDSLEIQEPIYDSQTKKFVNKDIFIVFSHGSEILQRIRKISESLDANIYEIDEAEDKRNTLFVQTNDGLSDLSTVLDTTKRTLETELTLVGRELSVWAQVIAKEKSVYQSLNLFKADDNRKSLRAEGWVPTADLTKIQSILQHSSSDLQSIFNVLSTTRTPPTYHTTNKFTDAFQNIVNAYGIAQYKEVNPGLPTIVTFPFMFAIMFGDLGHGFILSLAALALVLNEKKIAKIQRDEIFDMAYSGRYILLLMGSFSMLTGFFYNDLFSKSMSIWESGWKWPEHQIGETIFAEKVGVYPIGLDPAWHGTENALLFTNSYKMKLSILMGFIHMTYSYFFSLVNHIHFSSVIDILGNFIPGLLFMQGIFGYLSVCIVYKWSVDWIAEERVAPGLLNTLISMFLSPGTVEEPLYNNQASVQVFLLAVALICVPWLLLVKPLYFKWKFAQEAKQQEYRALHNDEQDEALQSGHVEHENGDDDDEEHEEHNFGDIMIHQVIHTIEFCLNSVSHTASYLRLWALSLAHAQLSTVLWSMTIEGAFATTGLTGVFATVFLFGMWFILTVVILVIMEGTSAMLHSLRLHWVESMSKFFVGGGNIYEPYSFKQVLSNIDL